MCVVKIVTSSSCASQRISIESQDTFLATLRIFEFTTQRKEDAARKTAYTLLSDQWRIQNSNWEVNGAAAVGHVLLQSTIYIEQQAIWQHAGTVSGRKLTTVKKTTQWGVSLFTVIITTLLEKQREIFSSLTEKGRSDAPVNFYYTF